LGPAHQSLQQVQLDPLDQLDLVLPGVLLGLHPLELLLIRLDLEVLSGLSDQPIPFLLADLLHLSDPLDLEGQLGRLLLEYQLDPLLLLVQLDP